MAFLLGEEKALSREVQALIEEAMAEVGVNSLDYVVFLHMYTSGAWDPHPGHEYIMKGPGPKTNSHIDVKNELFELRQIAAEIVNGDRSGEVVQQIDSRTWVGGFGMSTVSGAIVMVLIRSFDARNLYRVAEWIHKHHDEVLEAIKPARDKASDRFFKDATLVPIDHFEYT